MASGAGRSSGRATRYRYWCEPLDEFDVVETNCAQVADRVRIRYRYRFRGVVRRKGHQAVTTAIFPSSPNIVIPPDAPSDRPPAVCS